MSDTNLKQKVSKRKKTPKKQKAANKIPHLLLWHWDVKIMVEKDYVVDERSNQTWSFTHKFQYQFTIEQAMNNLCEVFKDYFTSKDYLFRKEVDITGSTHHINKQLPSAKELSNHFIKKFNINSTTPTDKNCTLQWHFNSKDYISKRTGAVKSKGQEIIMSITLFQELVDLTGATVIMIL